MISLYPHQEEFLNEIRSLWKSHKRIAAMAVTGFGKTRCSARIIEGFVSRGLRVCFIVPRVSLIEQTARSFSELGLDDITYLWGDYPTDYSAKITIASIDTYIRREKREFDLCIVDEAHHCRKKLCDWMDEFPDERYIGLSATPFGNWMGKYYTALAKSKSMRWMIDNGYLAPYDIYAPSKPDLSKVPVVKTPSGRDYKESALEEVMGEAKVVGNIVKNWLENGENRLTMALCVNVKHANHLCIEFGKHGVNAEVVTANTPIPEREAIFKRTREGLTRVILSVNCLTEGFDLPEISCLINARPTKSRARWSQGAGRSLRYVEGKRAIIFDHSATSLDLGYPEDMTIDELLDGSEPKKSERVKKEQEKKEKKPKECPRCSYVKPAGQYVCAKCGYKPLAGEDVETDESRELEIVKGTKKAYTKQQKQEFYSELIAMKNEFKLKGKPKGDRWHDAMYKQKFGVWAKGLHDSPKAPTIETRNYVKSRMIAFAKGRSNAN